MIKVHRRPLKIAVDLKNQQLSSIFHHKIESIKDTYRIKGLTEKEIDAKLYKKQFWIFKSIIEKNFPKEQVEILNILDRMIVTTNDFVEMKTDYFNLISMFLPNGWENENT